MQAVKSMAYAVNAFIIIARKVPCRLAIFQLMQKKPTIDPLNILLKSIKNENICRLS